MASSVFAIVTALGAAIQAKMGAGYDLRYGLPDQSAMGIANDEAVYIRLAQEVSTVATNLTENVRPRISIYVTRPHSGDPTTSASHEATLDMMTDVRVAIADRIQAHHTGATPIPGYSGPLFFEGQTSTPSVLSIGTGSQEAVTADFDFRFTRNVGVR